jgi:hypothetical protein
MDDGELRARLATAEMDVLRKELQGLKDCQIKLLSTAPVVTGFFIGLPQIVAKGAEVNLPLPLCALLPLLVLLPAWWTFFDKARTITRIVGYYRVLEATVRGDFRPRWFPGWERALEVFRRLPELDPLKQVLAVCPEIWDGLSNNEKVVMHELRPRQSGTQPLPLAGRWMNRGGRIAKVITLRERQRYWLIAYSMFLWLSILVVSLSAYLLYLDRDHNPHRWWFVGIASVVTLYSAWNNARSLSELMWGASSYLANQLTWLWLLRGNGDDREPARDYMDQMQ